MHLLARLAVLAAAFPFRAATESTAETLPNLLAVLGMLAGSMSMLEGIPRNAFGLLRHCGAGSVLHERAVWRTTNLPLSAGSVLGVILILSVWGGLGHLASTCSESAP